MITADLNPPLGKPGGPCQVVDRIVKRVRDPKLQKGLVDEVQHGDDLSNAEASKVYPVEAETGAGPIHRITITSHGQYRMDLRGITVDDVQRALASFVRQLETWRALKSPAYETFLGRMNGKENVEWVDPRSKLKIVFLQESPGNVRLITTFWRGQHDPPSPRGTCSIPGKTAMTPLLLRVVARYQRQADNAPWLPEFLGSKTHLVDEIIKAAKRIAADRPSFYDDSKDIKSICGGVAFYLIQRRVDHSLAQKLFNFFDSSSGLDNGEKPRDLAHSVASHLDQGDKGKVQAAGIAVALLQKSKQVTKGQRLNGTLVNELRAELAALGDPEEKSKPTSSKDAFLAAVKEQRGLATSTWGKIKDISKAATLVWKVMDDCNLREEAKITEGLLSSLVKVNVAPDSEFYSLVGGVSAAVDFGVVEAAAFGVALMEAAGQGAAAKRLFTALLKEVGQYLSPGQMFD